MTSKEIAHLEWYMKMLSIPPKDHHTVKANECHFSKVCLGFSDDAWVEIIQRYFRKHTDLEIDFSPDPDAEEIYYRDPYGVLYRNIPSECVVDIEVALRDYLEERYCLVVKYQDLELVRDIIGIENAYVWRQLLGYIEDDRLNIVNVLQLLCEHHRHRHCL